MGSQNGQAKVRYRSKKDAALRTSVLYVQVQRKLHGKIKKLAKESGVTISQLIESLLEEKYG